MIGRGDIEQAESQVLRDAVAAGVLYPSLPVFDKIDLKVFDWCSDNFKSQEFWQGDPQFAPQTQRYVEHNYPRTIQPLVNGVTQYWLVELARIPVPRGSVGYLRSIEQFLDDFGGGFYPTAAENWGLPYQADVDLSPTRWFLRLDNFDGQQPARINRSSAVYFDPEVAMRGQAFYDLAEIRELWYMPHGGNNVLNSVIPGGSLLRFFFYSPYTITWRWRVMGRLRAFVQSAHCQESQYNQRILT